MGTQRARASISLPIDDCWQKLRDFERAKYYVPGVADAVIETDQREGVGARRRIVQISGATMHETITSWDEGTGFTIRLHKGDGAPTPMREASFRYELAATATATGCEIHVAIHYELMGGAIARLLDRLVVGKIIRKTIGDVALALAHHYETDAPVTPEILRALR
jgi:carbon monoxide dehydrogenase subunit G